MRTQSQYGATLQQQFNQGQGLQSRNESPPLSSARVSQLKQEIENLDRRLAQTNTLRFEDVRKSHGVATLGVRNGNMRTHESYKSQQFNEKLIVEGYDMRQSCAQTQDKLKIQGTTWAAQFINGRQPDTRSQGGTQEQIKGNGGGMIQHYPREGQMIPTPMGDITNNISHLTQDGEVSFDIDKITQSRNLNLKKSLQDNLNEKRALILDLEEKLSLLKKEGEAKSLKLTHLKNERDSIINKIQIESIRRQEQSKEASSQVKQIEIKKREDERAFQIAQHEVTRQITNQQQLLGTLQEQIAQKQQEREWQQQIQRRRGHHSGESIQKVQERIAQQTGKAENLRQKKVEVDKNIGILKSFLKSISEEIQMTQEDLSGKLMQRAEFVAQREELDQMYESGKMAFGKSFELYLKIHELSDIQKPSGASSARFLQREYDVEKSMNFFQSILHQIKNQSKSKFHPMIDNVFQKIENSCLTNMDHDKCLTWIVECAQAVDIALDKPVLLRRLNLSSGEKDEHFSARHQQLQDIITEIRRFELLIKENTNMVDNMILPQLKAMSATYTEHKGKYKKLKQASFVLKERIKKAVRELEGLQEEKRSYEERDRPQSLERELLDLKNRLEREQALMRTLEENAEQIEKEYRRASQALLLKEREIKQRLEVTVSQSLSATQISALSNMRQQVMEDDRLKKRFAEIEDKIRDAISEKEEVDQRQRDYISLLQEAQDSCDHAERIINSQRSQGNQYKRQSNNQKAGHVAPIAEEAAYQVTSFTDNDEGGGVVMYQESHIDPLKHKRAVKESISKLDLSKIQNNLENNSYLGNGYQIVNHQLKPPHEATDYREVSSSLTNPLIQSRQGVVQRGEITGGDMNMFRDDFALQQSRYLDESTASQNNVHYPDKSSVMNLSELIVSNNPAIKNILQMAQIQEHRAQSLAQSTILQGQKQQQHYLQGDDQNRIYDQSTILNASADQSQNAGIYWIPGGGGQYRKSSVETAEFLLNNLDSKKQTQTIDVDLSHRQQLDNQHHVSPSINFNQQARSGNIRPNLKISGYLNAGAQNYNSLTHSTQRSSLTPAPQQNGIQNSLNKHLGAQTNQHFIRRFLNPGNTTEQQSRIHLQRSVSPTQNPIMIRQQQQQINNPHNQRSASLESQNRLSVAASIAENFGRMNQSTNSVGSMAMGGYSQNQSSHLFNTRFESGTGYSRSNSRGAANKKKLNKSLNAIDSSSMLLQQSMQSLSTGNPVALSLNLGGLSQFKSVNNGQGSSYIYNNHSLAGPECIQFSKVDVSFAERIVPLLDGAAFYKKFSSRQSLNENAFDPLNADKFPPENCGYGIRLFQLDKSLLCINVRMNLKIAVEMTIPLCDIVKPIIPQTTMDILRAQKHQQNLSSHNQSQHNHALRKSSRSGIANQISNKDLLEEFLIFENKGSISHLAKIGIVNKNSELYRQKCLDSSYYPFSIALTNGRVELIATSYETLKNWIIGINLMVSNKKHIPKLKQLMELKLD